MKYFLKHLRTVIIHRHHVQKLCRKMHIPLLGIVHDLSKFSFAELSIAKYWTGSKSPHQSAREILGYSPSWIHHYHLNKHHWQYWLDDDENTGNFYPIKMPYKYVIEMFCDMVAAGMTYLKDSWTTDSPWNYYEKKCKGKRLQHPASEYLLAKLFWQLKEAFPNDLEGFFKWYSVNRHFLEHFYNTDESNY